jgi:hypothetical protein
MLCNESNASKFKAREMPDFGKLSKPKPDFTVTTIPNVFQFKLDERAEMRRRFVEERSNEAEKENALPPFSNLGGP